ncbi:uncharacterized protein LOC143229826 [Tachypleus tridentatus]|uniref:uncharacterized protein LOC143229826 n=1 Tax=Tachypleus tridentatus TaxID=6853 RepID=UPI003FD6004A
MYNQDLLFISFIGLVTVTAVLAVDYVHHPIQYHSQTDRGTYNFGYDTGLFGAHSFRQEYREENGIVRGRYGYTDPYGKLRVVYYEAGPLGYKAWGDVYPDGWSQAQPPSNTLDNSRPSGNNHYPQASQVVTDSVSSHNNIPRLSDASKRNIHSSENYYTNHDHQITQDSQTSFGKRYRAVKPSISQWNSHSDGHSTVSINGETRSSTSNDPIPDSTKTTSMLTDNTNKGQIRESRSSFPKRNYSFSNRRNLPSSKILDSVEHFETEKNRGQVLGAIKKEYLTSFVDIGEGMNTTVGDIEVSTKSVTTTVTVSDQFSNVNRNDSGSRATSTNINESSQTNMKNNEVLTNRREQNGVSSIGLRNNKTLTTSIDKAVNDPVKDEDNTENLFEFGNPTKSESPERLQKIDPVSTTTAENNSSSLKLKKPNTQTEGPNILKTPNTSNTFQFIITTPEQLHSTTTKPLLANSQTSDVGERYQKLKKENMMHSHYPYSIYPKELWAYLAQANVPITRKKE